MGIKTLCGLRLEGAERVFVFWFFKFQLLAQLALYPVFQELQQPGPLMYNTPLPGC